MKPVRTVVLVVTAAAFGYAVGTVAPHKTGHASGGSKRGGDPARTASPSHPASHDAVAPVLGALLARGDLREMARLGALLDPLDATQMRTLFDALDRLPYAERENVVPRLLACWTKRDPDAATAWMQPHLARFAKDSLFALTFANADTELARAWAENAPEIAVAYARKHATTKLGEILLHTAIFAWPDKNEATRFELLRGFPATPARQKVITSFLFTWAQSDRAGALAAAAALPPSPEREHGLGEVLAKWAGREPAAAFEKAAALGLTSPPLLAIMAKEAAKRDPTAAARWLETQDAPLLTQVGGAIVKFWAQQDPAGAFAWAEAHGVSLVDVRAANTGRIPSDMFAGHAAEIGMDTPFSAAMRAKPEATLAWIESLPAGLDRERYVEIAIRDGADIATSQRLISELSPEAAARGAALIAARLAATNPAEAERWADSLPRGSMREEAWAALGTRTDALRFPPGPDRDAMLRGMASAQAITAPVQALERVLEIDDPALRQRTFDDVFWQLHRGPVELGHAASLRGASESALRDANEWLESAKVPEAWKKAWRDRLVN